MRFDRCIVVAALAATLTAGCAADDAVRSQKAQGPDARLADVLARWTEARNRSDGCTEAGTPTFTDCDVARQALEALSVEFPRHGPILLANAVVAFESREPERAQAYLDTLLAVEPVHPDAAVLRSRIAMGAGNLALARKTLSRQIHLAPDHAGLREAMSAVAYLSDDLEEARRSLDAAERLGAPAWRVAYHRGLIAEAEGDPAAAAAEYRRALAVRPDHRAAGARLRGLESETR